MFSSIFVRSTLYANALNNNVQHEQSVKQGVNTHRTGLIQAEECVVTITLISIALQSAGYPPLSNKLMCVSLLPLALGASLSTSEQACRHPDLHKMGLRIHNNFGSLCLCAATVSALAIIYFGHPISGITSLALLLFGHLARQGIIPQNSRYIYNKISTPLEISIGLLPNESWPIRLICLMEVWNVLTKYLSKRTNTTSDKPVFEPYSEGQRLTPDSLKKILASQNYSSLVEVNRHYITKAVLPPIPDRKLEKLLTLFDEIDWDNKEKSNEETLRSIVAADPRYIMRDQDKEPSDYRQYARDQLAILITSIKEKTILAGEPDPDSYALTEDYLKLTIQAMETCDEIDRVNALLRLSIEAGNYCGPGKLDRIEEVCLQIVSMMKSVSFTDKILLSLERIRQRKFMVIYYAHFFDNPVGRLIGWLLGGMTDIHNVHICQNMISKNWGIRQAGADQDAQAQATYISQLLITPVFDHTFWNKHHTSTCLTNDLSCRLGTPTLKLEAYTEWWRQWIDRLPDSPDKTDLLNELYTSGKLKDNDLLHPRLVAAMLVDMGVLFYHP